MARERVERDDDRPASAHRSGFVERRPAARLSSLVSCSWVSVLPEGGQAVRRIIPDASVDIVWMDGSVHVAGPDTRPVVARLPAGTVVAGIRFRPGAAPSLLGVPASSLRDERIDLALLWGRSATDALLERIGRAAAVPAAVMDVLESEIAARLPSAAPADRIVEQVVSELRSGSPGPRIRTLARRLYVSERPLLRRCEAAVGYGPKTLARVLRPHRFLALAERSGLRPSELASIAGYADPPHLSRECRELTGTTPARLLAERGVQERHGRSRRPPGDV